jgi:endonuclease/exonuclease/phosphatase family metal-dependent hydrolase
VLLEELTRLNPDVICLQEAFDPELVEQIQKILGFPNTLISLRSGLAIVTKFELSNEKTLAFETQSPTEPYVREAILAVLSAKMRGGSPVGGNTEASEFVVANTHLAWKSEDALVRLGQVKELMEAVKDGKQGVVLAGDLNDTPESPAIRELKRAGFKDAYELCHPAGSEVTWDNRNPFIQTHNIKFPDRRIDYLFFNEALAKQLKPKKCEIVFNRANREGIYPSDHYGVLAEL